MPALLLAAVVALAYLALAGLSWLLAYAPTDAWSVWLATSLTLGLLLVVPRPRWPAVLAGAAVGAATFSLLTDTGRYVWAIGYAAIEVLSAVAGAWVAAQVRPLPLKLERPRELAALVVGAIVTALVGGMLAGAWTAASGSRDGFATFNVWSLSDFVGALLVTPVVVSWAAFRAKRSGGLPMPQFIGGAIACLLFLGALQLLFGSTLTGRSVGSIGMTLTYPPILFIALVALAWGARGASLTAFAGALIALFNTVHGGGPFAAVEGFLGEANLEVQGYAAAVAVTGLLVAVLASRERIAWREARDWRTRFEATIGAHRLIAYEWNPDTGALAMTGDTAQLVGVAPAGIATLADWLSHVATGERGAIEAAFAYRADGTTMPPLRYSVTRGDGASLGVVDEAQAIRDHDGSLHRITGLVRPA